MKCDFYRDQNNKIWFFYAQDILSRSRIRSDAERLEEEAQARERQERMAKVREQMLAK